jgi:hypothetical protein
VGRVPRARAAISGPHRDVAHQNLEASQSFAYSTLAPCHSRLGARSFTSGSGSAKESPCPMPARPLPVSRKQAPTPSKRFGAPRPVEATAM